MATRDVESTLLACSEVTDGRSRLEPVRSLAASGSLARVTMFGLRRACGLMATVLAVLFSEAAAQATRHPHGTPPGGIVWDHSASEHTDAELGCLSDLWDPIRLTSVVHERQVVAAEQPGSGAAADPPERGRPDRDFYVEPRSVGTRRETEPPRYVRSLDQTGLPERWARSWLDVGLDHRLRFEYRHNDFRRPIPATDWPFLLRTRAYLGVKEIAPKTRLEFQPNDKVRIDMGYGVFWLASDTDSWANARRRDPTGQSGDFIGHELDIRVRAPVTRRLDLTLGYAHFIPGAFTRNTGWSAPGNFLYVETATRLFR